MYSFCCVVRLMYCCCYVARWMYWSDWSEERSRIERVAMDGNATSRRVIIDDVTWPAGLTIDYNEQRVSDKSRSGQEAERV